MRTASSARSLGTRSVSCLVGRSVGRSVSQLALTWGRVGDREKVGARGHARRLAGRQAGQLGALQLIPFSLSQAARGLHGFFATAARGVSDPCVAFNAARRPC